MKAPPVIGARRWAWPGLSRLAFNSEGPRPDAAPLEVRDPCYQLARIVRLGRALPYFDDNNARMGTWFEKLSEDPTARLALIATSPSPDLAAAVPPLAAAYGSLQADCVSSDGCFDPRTRRHELDRRLTALITQAATVLTDIGVWLETQDGTGASDATAHKRESEALLTELAVLHTLLFWQEEHTLPSVLQGRAPARPPKAYADITTIAAPDSRRAEAAGPLGRCLAAIDALMARVRQEARTAFDRLHAEGSPVAPHIALIFAYLAMYDRVAAQLNGLPSRYIDYLYRDWLGLRPAGAVADRVDVVLSAAENAGGTLVPAGTAFEAGANGAGKAIRYALDDSLVLSAARLVSVESLSLSPNRLGTLEARRTDRTKAKAPWPFLCNDPDADTAERLGFVLEGSAMVLPAARTLRLTLYLTLAPQGDTAGERLKSILSQNGITGDMPSSGAGQTLFEVSVRAAESWTVTDDLALCWRPGEDGRIILIARVTRASGAAHGGKGLRFLTHPAAQDLAAPEFALCPIEQIGIDIEAGGVTELYEARHHDRPVAATLATPFGAVPRNHANLALWSPLFKAGYRLTSLRFSWDWSGMPDSLVDYFAHYYRRLTRSAHDRRPYGITLIVRGASDDSLLQATSVTDGGPSAEIVAHAPEGEHTENPAAAELRLETPPFAFGHDQYGPMLAEAARQDRRWHPLRFILQSLRAFVHAFIIPVVVPVSDREQPLSLGLERRVRLAPLTLLRRFIKYRRRAESLKVPQPCTFQMRNLSFDFAGSLDMRPGDDDAILQMRHQLPGGRTVRARTTTLLPDLDRGHEVRLALSGVETGAPLSLLFDLPFVDIDPSLPECAVEWAVLDDGTWRPLADMDRGIDHTANLTRSGTLSLRLPAIHGTPTDANGARLYWLRALLRSDRPPLRRCNGIHMNGAALTHEAASGLPDAPLAKGSIKRLLVPMPAITSVIQPYGAYGGRAADDDARFSAIAARRLRSRGRAATAWDIEHAVMSAFPSIERVKCVPGMQPDGNLAAGHLLVIVASRPTFDSEGPRGPVPPPLCDDIRQMLAALAPAGGTVHVIPPLYQPAVVEVEIGLNRFADPVRWARLAAGTINRCIADAAITDGGLRLGGALELELIRRSLLDLSFVSGVERLAFTDSPDDGSRLLAVHPGAVLSPSGQHRLTPAGASVLHHAQSA